MGKEENAYLNELLARLRRAEETLAYSYEKCLAIARDVARRLLEAQHERKKTLRLPSVKKSFDLQLVVGN